MNMNEIDIDQVAHLRLRWLRLRRASHTATLKLSTMSMQKAMVSTRCTQPNGLLMLQRPAAAAHGEWRVH